MWKTKTSWRFSTSKRTGALRCYVDSPSFSTKRNAQRKSINSLLPIHKFHNKINILPPIAHVRYPTHLRNTLQPFLTHIPRNDRDRNRKPAGIPAHLRDQRARPGFIGARPQNQHPH